MNLNKLLKNRVVRNAGWIIGGRLTNRILAFLVGILTARYLGPANYGLISYATTYTTFFYSVCTLGISSIIIKDFIDYPQQEGEALGTALILRGISSTISAFLIVMIVKFIVRDEPQMVLIVALTSVGLVFQVFDTFTQWFQSRLQSQYAALARLISYIAASAYRLYLLATGKSVVWFAIATSVDHIAEALFLLYAYRRNNGPTLSCSVSKAKQLLSASSGFIVSGLMVSVYAATDKLMLKHMLDEAAVGYYGVAVSISTAWVFVLQAVIDSIQPSIIQAYDRFPDRFRKRNRQLYALVFYSATGISLMICLLAKPIILLLFGESYRPAIDPLRIVVWYAAFSYLGVARNAWIVCEHKQKYLKYLNLSAALINVALNLIMIPLWGPSGAALASVLTQIATSILLPAMIGPLRSNVRLILEAVLLKDVFPEKK